MTIKFERFADNYMRKNYFYDVWDDEDAMFRSGTAKKVTMLDYEFEQLFKDMAKELGYSIMKFNDDKITGTIRPFGGWLEQQKSESKVKSESEYKLELRLDKFEKRLKDVEDYIKMTLDEDDFWDE